MTMTEMNNRPKIKWEEIKSDNIRPVYSLWYGTQELASLSYYQNEWSLIPYFYSDKIGKRYYRDYSKDETLEIQFRATLDIMAVLNEIGTECYQCCNSISDYITKYLENSNEDS